MIHIYVCIYIYIYICIARASTWLICVVLVVHYCKDELVYSSVLLPIIVVNIIITNTSITDVRGSHVA